MPSPSFILKVGLGREVQFRGRRLDREGFYAWAWRILKPYGLLGVHEGTLLSEAAAEQGFETDSWTVDSAEAPRERDWVAEQSMLRAELYFGARAGAEAAAKKLVEFTGLEVGAIEEQAARDWDAEWKADFLSQAKGLVIPPNWHILPPWASEAEGNVRAGERVIRINPGAGFGTGTHETTQLCLTAISEEAARRPFSATARALDFGSGSGILSVALARLGARVESVEIDPLAIDNARENAGLNGATAAIDFRDRMSDPASAPYALIVANILRPVLLEFAESLVQRLAPGAPLVLSGLIERDVGEVRACYAALLGRGPARVTELREWRCIVWD